MGIDVLVSSLLFSWLWFYGKLGRVRPVTQAYYESEKLFFGGALVTSDTTLTYDEITSIYRKRWNIEPYHKSLKQNASLEKSPTQTVVTRTNHFFAALCGFIKLELLKGSTTLNHFALKSKLYFQAVQSAYATLNSLQPIRLAA